MKWISRSYKNYIENREKTGIRIISRKFLLFPKKLNHEVRWLEFAYVVEQFCQTSWNPPRFKWREIRWEDKEKTK